jgi:hypothetical protein
MREFLWHHRAAFWRESHENPPKLDRANIRYHLDNLQQREISHFQLVDSIKVTNLAPQLI